MVSLETLNKRLIIVSLPAGFAVLLHFVGESVFSLASKPFEDFFVECTGKSMSLITSLGTPFPARIQRCIILSMVSSAVCPSVAQDTTYPDQTYVMERMFLNLPDNRPSFSGSMWSISMTSLNCHALKCCRLTFMEALGGLVFAHDRQALMNNSTSLDIQPILQVYLHNRPDFKLILSF